MPSPMTKYYSPSTGTFYPTAHGAAHDSVPISDELYASLMGKPCENDVNGMPQLKLSWRRENMWTKIKDERDRRKDGGVKVGNSWFHSDADSRIQQLALVMMGANVPPVQWKTLSGSYETMSPTLAMGIFTAMATLDMVLFARAEQLRAQVYASSNPELINIKTGWPQSYEDTL